MDIDEIVLSYVISILEEASQDPCFDVEGFIEMMSGFFPQVDFARIAPEAVCTWLFKLASELSQLGKEEGGRAGSVEREISLTPYLAELCLTSTTATAAADAKASTTPPLKKERVQLLSETSDCGSTDSSTFDFFSDECDTLQEMFPESSPLEVKQCITIANGCLEKAIQILLYRQENDQSIVSSNSTVTPKAQSKVNDTELKNRIIERWVKEVEIWFAEISPFLTGIAFQLEIILFNSHKPPTILLCRYSYVDKAAVNKEYKPVVPKVEPKKMVRYLDNKIVSLRGERFTEVRRNGDDDAGELKKPKKPICP